MFATAVQSASKSSSESVASLQAFRKRHDEVKRVLADLQAQPTSVDFAHYRSTLKNQKVVDQSENALKTFKPVTYNLDAQLKAIDQFQAKAVQKAQSTVQKIDGELKDLQATLKNIQNSRPIDQLTVDDIITAKPDLTKNVEKMLENGKFNVPGYKEKFGDISYF
ncbi:unnamed protein product [Absidia cylindrospora]